MDPAGVSDAPLARDRSRGIGAALLAAALFGAGTPVAKWLMGGLDTAGAGAAPAEVSPWMMAALLYLGSGIGLALLRMAGRARRTPRPGGAGGENVSKAARCARLAPGEWRWLAGAVAAGGVAGPVLLMAGLAGMPASGASLLLNAEGVFTAMLAWFVFKENFDRRIALGMAAIVAGALVLSWPQPGSAASADAALSFGSLWPALAVLGACFAWAVDNNLTRKVSLADASWIAMVKGLAAGSVNLGLATLAGAAWPPAPVALGTAALGFLAYGASLTLFVVGLRHLGAARAGAYFSVAPFFGALLAVAWLGEAVTPALLLAGALMAFGVWLHLSERHEHAHHHEAIEHEHEHEHDDAHHDHHHDDNDRVGDARPARHSHRHRHEPLTHAHAHFPDEHHRHSH